MAAPNIYALTAGKIDSVLQIATTSLADITWPISAGTTVPTGHAFNIEALYCANYHASVAAKITIIHKKGGTEYKLVPLLRVPVGQCVNGIPGRPHYMAEGDSLRIVSDTATAILVAIPYVDLN